MRIVVFPLFAGPTHVNVSFLPNIFPIFFSPILPSRLSLSNPPACPATLPESLRVAKFRGLAKVGSQYDVPPGQRFLHFASRSSGYHLLGTEPLCKCASVLGCTETPYMQWQGSPRLFRALKIEGFDNCCPAQVRRWLDI